MSTPFKDRKPPSDAEIREYFQILKEDGRSRVFAPLTEALIRRGRLDEAEQICRYGIDHSPDFSDGHLAMARVLFYRFRYQEAVLEVKLTLALDSQSVEAYLIAAEIFMARSLHEAASDACLKALDLEPDNAEAIRLLERVGQAPAPQPGQPAPARFKATAGTAPSRRQLEPDAPPAMTNPFQQLMQELEGEAAERLDEEQPFTALSAGSQTDVPALADKVGLELLDADFEIPTAPVERPPADVPKLPVRPPTGDPVPASPAPAPVAQEPAAAQVRPEFDRSTLPPTPPPTQALAPSAPRPTAPLDDLLAQVPGAQPPVAPRPAAAEVSAPPPEPSPPEASVAAPAAAPAPAVQAVSSPVAPPRPSAQTTSAWRRVDAAQAVIDAYQDRIPDSDPDEPPLRVPRLSGLLPLLGVLALLAAAVALILVLVPKDPPPKPPGPVEQAPRNGPVEAPPARVPAETPGSAGQAGPGDEPIVGLPLPDEDGLGDPDAQADGPEGEPAPGALVPAEAQAESEPDPVQAPDKPKNAIKKKKKTAKRQRPPRRRRTR